MNKVSSSQPLPAAEGGSILGHSSPVDLAAKIALPLLAGIFTWLLPTAFSASPDDSMADFAIYLEGARAVVEGHNLYEGGPNTFIYPPFAALLFVPFLLGPVVAWKILWALVGWLGIIAVVHRFGLRSWNASVVAAACIATCGPVTMATDLGQIQIILTCAVILDLVPGPTLFGRRLVPLPRGWMVGLMTAIKLTPGLFIVHLLVTRQWRTAVTSMVSAAAFTLLGVVVLPQQSWFYWTRLLTTGSIGFDSDPIYFDNQSFEGATLRLFKLAEVGSVVALLLSLAALVLALLGAHRLHRNGFIGPAIALIGITTALVSPVSWSHHFVWIVPLAVSLMVHRPNRFVGFTGTLFVLWAWLMPYRVLPGGGKVELDYTLAQAIFSAVTPVLGLLLLVAAVTTGGRVWNATGEAPPLPGTTPGSSRT